MTGESGEQSRGGSGEFVVPDYNSMNPEQLIEEAQKVTTKAEIGRLFSFLAARLTDPSRIDRDMTMAALQMLTARREKLAEIPKRNDDMVFEGSNPEVTHYSTEESLTDEKVKTIFDEIISNSYGKTSK